MAGRCRQNAREEVDTPVLAGANFGWRVYEGTNCTNNDSALCRPGTFVAPLFDYGHSNGRCSITGGYVYRGQRATFDAGTYVYGDYCSGEIFTWDGRTQTLLLNAGFDVTSFGEDEQGEIYVAGATGVVARFARGCVSNFSPTAGTATANGGSAMLNVTADPRCHWSAGSDVDWIALTSGTTGHGDGTIAYNVQPLPAGASSRTGTITVAKVLFSVTQR